MCKPMCLWLHSNIGSIAISGSLNRWDRWLHATYGTRKLHWLDHVFCCTLFHWLFRCWFIVDLSFWTFFFNCFFASERNGRFFVANAMFKISLSDFVSMLQAKTRPIWRVKKETELWLQLNVIGSMYGIGIFIIIYLHLVVFLGKYR